MGIFASGTKTSWTKEEDQLITTYVDTHGSTKWGNVADILSNEALHNDKVHTRTGKQCRERWHNQLNPRIKKGHWTAEEDELIISAVNGIYGTRWADISHKVFRCTRSDNDIKNHWNSTLKRQIDTSVSVEKPVTEKQKRPRAACFKRKADSHDGISDDDSEDEATQAIILSTTCKAGRHPLHVRTTPEFVAIKHKKPKAPKRAHSVSSSDDEASDDDSEDEATLEITPSAMGKSDRYPARIRLVPDFFTNEYTPIAPKKARSRKGAPLPHTPTSTVASAPPLATDARVAPLLSSFSPGICDKFSRGGPLGSSPKAPLPSTPTSTVTSAPPLITDAHRLAPLLSPFPPGIYAEFPSDGPPGGSPFEDPFQSIAGQPHFSTAWFLDGDDMVATPPPPDDYDLARSLTSSPLPTTNSDVFDFPWV